MDAKARNFNQIFGHQILFEVPLFQRPYVWSQKDNWEPLWDDISSLLDRYVEEGRCREHFLGAVVLEQISNVAGALETHQVIDGQQRFTTLQLFMLAARDIAAKYQQDKYIDRFNVLTTNLDSMIELKDEKYKLLPTNIDRKVFRLVHEAGSPAGLDSELGKIANRSERNHKISGCYRYFYDKIDEWLSGDDITAASEASRLDAGMQALWHVVNNAMQIVVINLDADDESQVIFETLNARGTQLLPADLIKNYLFRSAQAEGLDIEKLYSTYWSEFDTEFWRKEVKQGRIKRPRIDLFIQHYLSLMIREEIRTLHIFDSFKKFVLGTLQSTTGKEEGITSQPRDITEHLQYLARYSESFRTFAEPRKSSRLQKFLERLEAIDTATVYPLLLLACDRLLPDNQQEFDSFLAVLESYLVRRMICNLTAKNYNKIFLDVIREFDSRGVVTAFGLNEILSSYSGESNRYPSDEELRNAFHQMPVYKTLARYKLRAVLAALDEAYNERKSEIIELPKGLTVEHVMPQEWQQSWPIPEHVDGDPEAKLEFIRARDEKIHTLGNLTLITSSLNPSLSNSSWSKKKPELLKFSKLNLNRYFHDVDDRDAAWNEEEISKRADYLFEKARSIWR